MPGERPTGLRYIPANANGQLALDAASGRYLPIALDVLTLRGRRIADITAFRTPDLFPSFGLPAELGA